MPTGEVLEDRLWRTVADGLDDPEPEAVETDHFHNPYQFVLDAFMWPANKAPTAYQIEILKMLTTNDRIAVRGPHGLGKTAVESWIILWFACTREAAGVDWKIPTTAGAWHQLTHYLWPEIHQWARLLRPQYRSALGIEEGKTLLQLSLRLRHGEAFAVASNRAELIEGAHASELMYVFDEAKAIGVDTWDAAEGAFAAAGPDTGASAKAVAASTPGAESGRFYDICMRKAGYEDWEPRHVTLDEAIAAGRIARAWAASRGRQWGVTSTLYQNRVLGEFSTSSGDTVIPLAWIEAAQARWRDWADRHERLPAMEQLGVDVGRGGNKTVLAPRHGHIVPRLYRSNTADTMRVANDVADILDQNPDCLGMIDVIGIGAGVLDRLRELRKRVAAFNAGAKSPFADSSGELGFVNRRAEGWWRMRELLDPNSPDEPVLLYEDDDGLVAGDLAEPKWRDVGGKILVEEKEEVQRRLGRSTDDGDAIIMTFAPPVAKERRPFSGAVAGERSTYVPN